MCGRYAASRDAATLIEEFGVQRSSPSQLAPDFNVAPSKDVYIVAERRQRTIADKRQRTTAEQREGEVEAHRELAIASWGLVPGWAKDPKIGYRMINARVETLAEKPAYRSAFKKRRCLLPADGYYEWYTPTDSDAPKGRAGKPLKQPYYIHPVDNSVLAMAGLYEFWHERGKNPEDPASWLMTTTVVTTEASEGLSRIHDRMPLRVPRESWSEWLNPQLQNPVDLSRALVEGSASSSAGWLQADAVGREVNNVRNNGPGLVLPLPSG